MSNKNSWESYLWLPPYLQNSILFLPLINISVTFSYCYNLVSQISSKRRCPNTISTTKKDYATHNKCNSEVAEKFIRCYLWQTVIATFRIRKDDKQADAVTFHYNRHENDKYIQQSFNPTYPRNHFRTIRYEISHARHLKIIKNLYPAILSMKQHALRNFSKWYVAIAILSSFGYNPFKRSNRKKELYFLELYYKH